MVLNKRTINIKIQQRLTKLYGEGSYNLSHMPFVITDIELIMLLEKKGELQCQ